jgi:hypothetical protein
MAQHSQLKSTDSPSRALLVYDVLLKNINHTSDVCVD